MKETSTEVEKPLTKEDRIRIAERYWIAMRIEMNLAQERETKAFERYQELLRE